MGDFNYPDIDWDTWDSKGDSTDSIEYKFVESPGQFPVPTHYQTN
jgi:hypothetical protein